MSTEQAELMSPGGADKLASAVQDLQEELIACQRLALLGNMTAMIAHEFNNLLTPVLARAEAALTCADDGAFVRRSLERIVSQTQRAIAVSRRLLTLAHENGPAQAACSVASAVREAVATLPRPFEKDGITLRVAVPDDLRVAAHAELLTQVLLNLLLNARRAMQGRPGALAISARVAGDAAQIDVRDSGCGLAPELLSKVFNPFLAADPLERPSDWQRVGLGLSVCRMITRHHGALLQGLANEDRGCTFRLLWPLASNGTPVGSA